MLVREAAEFARPITAEYAIAIPPYGLFAGNGCLGYRVYRFGYRVYRSGYRVYRYNAGEG